MSECVKANWLMAKDTDGTLTLTGSIKFQIRYMDWIGILYWQGASSQTVILK